MKAIMHRDLVNITVANTLRHFGGAMVEVFVPLLLLSSGLSLLGVSMFYLLYSVTKLCINYPAMRITNKHGARRSLIYARISYAMYLLCLVQIVGGSPVELAWIMACFLAITNAFQWNAQHVHISRVINMERKGKDIARIDSIDMLASSFAPAISAILALTLGKSWPLYVAIISIVASIFWLRNIDHEAGGHKKEAAIRYSLNHAPKRDLIANFAFNVHSAVGGIVWPMYLAIALPGLGSIGAVATIGAIGASIFILLVGTRNDSLGTTVVLKEGSIATFVAHLLRLVPASIASISLVNVFWLFALRYQQNPWTSTYYAHTRQKGMNYILSMEIACDLAYVFLFMLVYLVLSVAGNSIGFPALFVFASLASLLCTVVTPASTKA